MNTVKVLLVVLLLWSYPEFAEAQVLSSFPRTMQDLRGETVLVPHSVPETRDFVLVTYFKITLDEELIFIVALYDDPKTSIEVDYVELYRATGDLLGIAWLDEFGIRRTAVDYGLVGEEPARLTGVLILLDYGNSV